MRMSINTFFDSLIIITNEYERLPAIADSDLGLPCLPRIVFSMKSIKVVLENNKTRAKTSLGLIETLYVTALWFEGRLIGIATPPPHSPASQHRLKRSVL